MGKKGRKHGRGIDWKAMRSKKSGLATVAREVGGKLIGRSLLDERLDAEKSEKEINRRR